MGAVSAESPDAIRARVDAIVAECRGIAARQSAAFEAQAPDLYLDPDPPPPRALCTAPPIRLGDLTAAELEHLGHVALGLARERRSPLGAETVAAALATGLLFEANAGSSAAPLFRLRGAARSLVLAGWHPEPVTRTLLAWAADACPGHGRLIAHATACGLADAGVAS